jgi:hypothetical protein
MEGQGGGEAQGIADPKKNVRIALHCMITLMLRNEIAQIVKLAILRLTTIKEQPLARNVMNDCLQVFSNIFFHHFVFVFEQQVTT